MKIKDRFVIWIILAVVGLITTTFFIIQNYEEAEYKNENNPEAVVYDYILALNLEEFNKAYPLISTEIPNYPENVIDFEYDLESNRWQLDNMDSFSIKKVLLGNGEATVIVSLVEFYQGDLFNSGQSQYEDKIKLRKENGEWKIYESQHFFYYCWGSNDMCR